ncbi:class I SAM-dependent methyltransferase [Caulobacter soli]|uniref:class I SAM-dependent methyltransferase n=1 Tax=Caulobacter soli TaxID=2708539 RepID=UPI0013EBDF3B|nr:class I SAM-dependent methyltransferase [Caulobacter soli]
MITSTSVRVQPYLRPGTDLHFSGGIWRAAVRRTSPGLDANRHYFSHPVWLESWLKEVHRYPELKARWLAATGAWDDRVVVDLGCGPGNLFALIGGRPKALIGVDIATGSLERAEKLGYTTIEADAQDTPLASDMADIVAINGTLHHCDDMAAVLREAARLVRPGGLIVVDHDPQRSAWNFRGLALWLWKLRLPLYKALDRGGHRAWDDEQRWALATELHHKPGDGVSEELFRQTLEPLGFQVDVYPHNNKVGGEVFEGVMARPPLKIRLAQAMSGISSDARQGAITLMCVARKRPAAA